MNKIAYIGLESLQSLYHQDAEKGTDIVKQLIRSMLSATKEKCDPLQNIWKGEVNLLQKLRKDFSQEEI